MSTKTKEKSLSPASKPDTGYFSKKRPFTPSESYTSKFAYNRPVKGTYEADFMARCPSDP